MKLRLALKQRCATALYTEHGAGTAFGRTRGKLALELGPATRVLVAIGQARRRSAVELRHFGQALALDAPRKGDAVVLKAPRETSIGGAAAAGGRSRQRQDHGGMPDAEFEARRGAHREADQVRLGDLESP